MWHTYSLWLRLHEFVGLLIISISAGRTAACASAGFPSEISSTSDGYSSHISYDGESRSERPLPAELSALPVLRQGDTASPHDEPQFKCSRSVHYILPFQPEFAGDVGTSSSGDRAGGSEPGTKWRTPTLRDARSEDGFPLFPSLVAHSDVNVNSTTKANASPNSPTRRRPWWRRLWSRTRGLFSRGRNAFTRHITPFISNRFVLLVAHTISTILSSGCFFAWPSIRSILFSQGAFSNSCTRSSNGTFLVDMRRNGTEYICNEQDARVQGLFALGSAVYCVVAAVGGIAYERLGPRFAAVTGQLLNIVGWVTLAFSWAPTLAVAIIAAVLPLTSFPSYCVRHLFPGHEQVVMMLLSAALSASVMMPQLILEAAKSVDIIPAVGGFIVVALVPSLCVALFLTPRRDFSERTTSGGGGCDSSLSCARASNTSESLVVHRRSSRLRRACHMLRHILPWRALFSRHFILLLLYRTVSVLTIGYYFQSSTRMLPAPANDVLGSVLISSPLFCLLCGLASYVMAPVDLMVVTSVAGLLSYVLLFVRNSDAPGYLSTLSFSMYFGTAASQTLTYSQAIVSERDFPPLAGILVMVSGLLSSLSALLYADVTTKLLDGDNRVVQIACVAALVIQFILLFFLRPRKARIKENTPRRRLGRTASRATPSQDTDEDVSDHSRLGRIKSTSAGSPCPRSDSDIPVAFRALARKS